MLVFEAGIGTSNIVLTAHDGKGGTAQDNFSIKVGNASGLEETITEEILIYPNPATDYSTIEVSGYKIFNKVFVDIEPPVDLFLKTIIVVESFGILKSNDLNPCHQPP